jgi:hypothetical protein
MRQATCPGAAAVNGSFNMTAILGYRPAGTSVGNLHATGAER